MQPPRARRLWYNSLHENGQGFGKVGAGCTLYLFRPCSPPPTKRQLISSRLFPRNQFSKTPMFCHLGTKGQSIPIYSDKKHPTRENPHYYYCFVSRFQTWNWNILCWQLLWTLSIECTSTRINLLMQLIHPESHGLGLFVFLQNNVIPMLIMKTVD